MVATQGVNAVQSNPRRGLQVRSNSKNDVEISMNLKQSVLTAALAATMAMASGQAAAYVYADSALSVDNLAIVITGGDVTVNTFGFTATNTATLDGASSPVQSAS